MTTPVSESVPERRGGKPWPKGVSGNPKGRAPRGYSSAEKIRAALAEELPAVIAQVVKAAKGGDVRAAEVLLKLALPPLKPIEPPVKLDIPTDSTLAAQGAALLAACARGELPPSQAANLMMGLGAQARVVEVDELKRRMEVIEARLGGKVS